LRRKRNFHFRPRLDTRTAIRAYYVGIFHRNLIGASQASAGPGEPGGRQPVAGVAYPPIAEPWIRMMIAGRVAWFPVLATLRKQMIFVCLISSQFCYRLGEIILFMSFILLRGRRIRCLSKKRFHQDKNSGQMRDHNYKRQ